MVERGTFRLHSFLTPPVTAGHYQLRGTIPIPELPVDERVDEVIVSAPRFTMSPDQILSTFPPAMAEGDFGGRLPQIVLKRRTLPWERDPGGAARAATDPPRPWLALVVLAEGEGTLSSDPVPVTQCVTPGWALPHPEDADTPTALCLTVTQTVVDKVFPTVEDLPLLVHVREVDIRDTELANGDDDGWLAVVLANRLPLAAPHTDRHTGETVSAPVKYLACLVNLEGQVDVLPTDAQLATQDHFDIFGAVQDLRFTAAAAPSTDHVVMGTGQLVDLAAAGSPHAEAEAPVNLALPVAEAAAPSLGTVAQWSSVRAGASTPGAADVDAAAAVRRDMASPFTAPFAGFLLEPVYRFPVLAHWSFTATNDGDFRSLAQALDVGLLGTQYGSVYGVDPDGAPNVKVEHPNAPRLGDPPRPAPPEVAETGHVALPQTTRRGDTATAWYRGPFGPLPTVRDPADSPLPAVSDQLRALTPDGREDVSLAAAFEIGRLLGLSQPALVRALLAWRSEQFGAARLQKLADVVTRLAGIPVDDARLDQRFGRLVGLRLMAKMADDPAGVAGPTRPLADPGRAIGIDGPLDQVVAAGLNLDLRRLQQSARQVGMAAALAQTDVAVVLPEGPFDPAAITGLRAALDSELGRVAAAAARPTVAEHAAAEPSGATARVRSDERDPLDDLLDRLSSGSDT